MARNKTSYICSECGYESLKQYGKCPSCGQWNTLEEQIVEEFKPSNSTFSRTRVLSINSDDIVSINNIVSTDEERYKTGLKELDRVLGGGIVKGSVVLLGGDPGIGKSTMLLQICQYLGQNLKVLYVSGEESARQLKLRADRLRVNSENLYILTDTNAEIIVSHINNEQPNLVIIDSIQTMTLSELSSSAGSVVQVRECTNLFMKTAKSLDIPTLIVGHVNKDGAIAGPKVLEHIVDAVLYFEGEKQMIYRILRAVKNRYGSTNEIGVFEMGDNGIKEVENPSLMLLSGRPSDVSGSCVACVMEGSRPILAEVQGLATPTGFGNPRRMATGFDYNRLNLLLAVLEKRAGYYFANMDTYVNVIGGLKLDEPASDLAVALSLVSSLKDKAISDKVLAFGEIGLSGEIRSVSHAEERIKEASRLGFEKCIIPMNNFDALKNPNKYKIKVIGVKNVRQAFSVLE